MNDKDCDTVYNQLKVTIDSILMKILYNMLVNDFNNLSWNMSLLVDE